MAAGSRSPCHAGSGHPGAWTTSTLAAAGLLFAAMVLAQRHYVPLWDSWIYANCVQDAIDAPSDVSRYACAGHPTYAYAGLLTLPGRAGLGVVAGILLVNALLGLGALAALWCTARSMFPGRDYRLDCALAVLICAVHPALLASAVFVNPDYGIWVFGAMDLACLLRRRFGASAIVGLLLVFTKEVGGLVHGLLVLCCWSAAAWGWSGTLRSRWRATLRWWPVAVPLVAAAVYWTCLRPRGVSWSRVPASALLDDVTTLDPWSSRARATLALLFVLNFSWIPTAAILIAGALRTCGRCARRQTPLRPGVHEAHVRATLWATALVILALTRIRTSVMVRYLAIVYPWLVLVLLAVLVYWIRLAWLRRGVLLSCATLFVVSTFRTIDPVSRYLYGTFRFGEHRWLAMTSISQECCGRGLDQLVYNLEFVRLHEALDEVLAGIRPSWDAPLVLPDAADWFLLPRRDKASAHRVFARAGAERPPHMDTVELLTMPKPPSDFDFLALPTADYEQARSQLESRYREIGSAAFGRDGYWMKVHRMTSRPRP